MAKSICSLKRFIGKLIGKDKDSAHVDTTGNPLQPSSKVFQDVHLPQIHLVECSRFQLNAQANPPVLVGYDLCMYL